jgi:hypothetical protein
MKRYLDKQAFERVSHDFFKFRFKAIRKSRGELDFRLRNGYFNIYYKGNSLAKVTIRKDEYLVSIHHKFATEDVFKRDERFNRLGERHGDYIEFRLTPKLLHPFFQKKYAARLGSNIAKVNYSEEITFEHMLITDNMERDDFFIIDRQVTETAMERRTLDLLTLKQKQDNRFHFFVMELKLGNNPELRKEVGDQLLGYINHIKAHFPDWKASYEITYRQLKGLGLFDRPEYDEIEIVKDTEGMVVVGGYSGIAAESIRELKNEFPNLEIKQLKHRL